MNWFKYCLHTGQSECIAKRCASTQCIALSLITDKKLFLRSNCAAQWAPAPNICVDAFLLHMILMLCSHSAFHMAGSGWAIAYAFYTALGIMVTGYHFPLQTLECNQVQSSTCTYLGSAIILWEQCSMPHACNHLSNWGPCPVNYYNQPVLIKWVGCWTHCVGSKEFPDGSDLCFSVEHGKISQVVV